MNDAIRKADVLIEALSYIRTFRDKRIVIKLGGGAMEEDASLQSNLQDVVFMATVGLRPILVHGGGKPIDRAMAAAGMPARKIQGRRYTDEATLSIVVRVLQELNAGIVGQLRGYGGRAVGLHTGPLQCLFAERFLLPQRDGPAIDLGRVGKVTRVEKESIETFCGAGVIPVIPSVGMDSAGQWLNINADTAAAAVAAEVRAEKLVFLSDTPGILLDRADESSLLPTLDPAQCRDLIARKVIEEGMIPKVEACLDCLKAGVGQTHMIDGRVKHSLLLEIYTDKGVGTEIRELVGGLNRKGFVLEKPPDAC